MITKLFTIGYAGFGLPEFLTELKKRQIQLVIDVRSQPFSKYYADYNQDRICNALKNENIYYRNYAKEFGARQENKVYYSSEGYLDFSKFSKSEVFQNGIERLCLSMQKGYSFVLMCAEKDPIDCHRAILVSRAFHEKGYQVEHILPNEVVYTQEDINQRLVDKYFPNRNQLSFLTPVLSDEEMIQEAYCKQNAEIGYRMEATE